jgi:hypothetical protein
MNTPARNTLASQHPVWLSSVPLGISDLCVVNGIFILFSRMPEVGKSNKHGNK